MNRTSQIYIFCMILVLTMSMFLPAQVPKELEMQQSESDTGARFSYRFHSTSPPIILDDKGPKYDRSLQTGEQSAGAMARVLQQSPFIVEEVSKSDVNFVPTVMVETTQKYVVSYRVDDEFRNENDIPEDVKFLEFFLHYEHNLTPEMFHSKEDVTRIIEGINQGYHIEFTSVGIIITDQNLFEDSRWALNERVDLGDREEIPFSELLEILKNFHHWRMVHSFSERGWEENLLVKIDTTNSDYRLRHLILDAYATRNNTDGTYPNVSTPTFIKGGEDINFYHYTWFGGSSGTHKSMLIDGFPEPEYEDEND